LKVKSALITGTHRGLGEALALNLLEKGATVYGVSRNQSEKLDGKDNWKFMSKDLNDLDKIAAALQKLLDGVNELDLVILNAGVAGDVKELHEWSLDDLRWQMNVNVWASKVILDSLINQGMKVRQIIGISSGAAIKGSDGIGGYSISKAALNSLLQIYAHEQRETHFTSLAPGQVMTAMTRWVHDQPRANEFSAPSRLKEAYDSGKMIQPDEAAERIISALPKLLQAESGSYQDIREIA
jgi:benzil reductase ((S)-benzoin forming)